MSTPLELLCPARDLACGLAAINHGADAVYIGASKFGARAAAGNSLSDIEQLVAHAHAVWARVYVTLNTILYDHELDEARALAQQIYDAGADALIIQDMGLLELDLPPIALIASTQMHNYEVERIKFLEQVGIQRVILARELSLEQIRVIRRATTIDLEFFVHGALCMSMSGRCYLSQAAHGRSANRGECAQMCRLPYTLSDSDGRVLAENQHLLSLKDLDLSDHLADLVDAGVTSFKIEGRLKDVDTVKNVTAFYRAKLDALMETRAGLCRASSGKTAFSFNPDPERTFGRGRIAHFIAGRRRGSVSLSTPKSLGKRLGTVLTVGQGHFTVESAEELHNGDGICFFDDRSQLTGININRVNAGRVFPHKMANIRPGLVLYRNYDSEFAKGLKAASATRKIGVRLAFGESANGFTLRAVDEEGNEATGQIVHAKEPANMPGAARDQIEKQLRKLGETLFRADDVSLEANEVYFVPVGVLNQLRRDCVMALIEARQRHFPRQQAVRVPNEVPYPERTLDYAANVVNEKARQFYRRHGVQRIEPGLELQKDASGKVLATSRYCLRFELGLCRGEKEHAEEMGLTHGTTRYTVRFDCDACVMKISLAGGAGSKGARGEEGD